MPSGVYKRIKGVNYFPEKIGFQKGYKPSEETKRKIGKASKGNKYHLGKYHTDETKKKMSKAGKGKKKSQEWKDKIGKANKGKRRTEETKKKISKAKTGTVVSEKIKKKISENSAKFWKGKIFSDERRKNMSIAHIGQKAWNKGKPNYKIRGEKCHFWKGGISSENIKIRNSLEYRNWRKAVFERDNYTCQECGVRSGNGKAIYLEAHHLKEFCLIIEFNKIKTLKEAFNCKELWDISNGQTLCKKCHNKTKKGNITYGKK